MQKPLVFTGSALTIFGAGIVVAGWPLFGSALAASGAVASLLSAWVGRASPVESIDEPIALPEPPAAAAKPAASKTTIASPELQQLRGEIERHKQLESELLSAKQAAEAAMMAKGEFLATMSHEIRTPLNGIIPLLDILLSSQLGPDQREYVQIAFTSARQLLRIVDDILDYSKLEANKLELESVGLNLKEVLEGVRRLMEKPAESKKISLNLTIDPAVRLAVRGDPVRMRQVLTNLVSNAVKFTERGGVSINVMRRGETRTHHELRFEVKDTGIGIAPESAAKLFQPFSQGDTSTTRTFGGTGLGLVICKRIVDLAGGQIGVDSEPGKGSTFWFQLPLMKAVGDMGGGRQQGLQGARVLVLSADPNMLRRLSVSLPLWGATPLPAATTQEALSKIRATSARSESWGFQLLIVDLSSIKASAVGLHRNLQKEPGAEQLHVVYLQGDEPPPVEIVTNERFLLLPKTLADGEMRQAIQRLLAGATVSGPQAAAEVRIKEPAAESGIGAIPEGGLSGHVLLVEDNPVNRQVAQRLLTITGLTLDSAENGQEAIERLAQGKYLAVLMDCQMPVMDGYKATRERRQFELANGLPRIPIIAMTANAMVGDREKCLASGMDDYLTKPLNRGLLEQTLRRWLAAGAAATAPDAKTRQSPTVAKPAPTSAIPSPQVSPTPRGTIHIKAVPTTASSPESAAAPIHGTANVNAIPAAKAAGVEASPKPVLRPLPPVSTAEAVNREVVDDLREIMGAEFESLVRVFLEDAPRAIAKLDAAAAANEVDGLVGSAHSLKSTSANLGALELSAIAKHIEHGARQKTLQDPPVRVAMLRREFERVRNALLELIAKG